MRCTLPPSRAWLHSSLARILRGAAVLRRVRIAAFCAFFFFFFFFFFFSWRRRKISNENVSQPGGAVSGVMAKIEISGGVMKMAVSAAGNGVKYVSVKYQ